MKVTEAMAIAGFKAGWDMQRKLNPSVNRPPVRELRANHPILYGDSVRVAQAVIEAALVAAPRPAAPKGRRKAVNQVTFDEPSPIPFRRELIARIRAEIAAGTYETAAKLGAAVGTLMDLLTEGIPDPFPMAAFLRTRALIASACGARPRDDGPHDDGDVDDDELYRRRN